MADEDIRANDLRVGDAFREYGDDEEETVAIRGDHGDTVLVTTSMGHERAFDIDEVVERTGHVDYLDEELPAP